MEVVIFWHVKAYLQSNSRVHLSNRAIQTYWIEVIPTDTESWFRVMIYVGIFQATNYINEEAGSKPWI